MKADFPRNAAEIYEEWITTSGGIRALAFTDADGIPYIGLCPLNRMGSTNGLPCWIQTHKFQEKTVIGFNENGPIVALIGIELDTEGLHLSVTVRLENRDWYENRSSAVWGSKRPNYSFIVVPTHRRMPINPFPASRERAIAKIHDTKGTSSSSA